MSMPRELSAEQARRAAHEVRSWVERLGRFGYAAKGVVYGIIGGLAAQAAIGPGGATTDTRGALAWIVQAPFGRFLLGTVAVGLAGYALWRLVQSALDTEDKGTEAGGVLARAGYAVVGVAYAALALSAIGLVLGSSGGSDGGSAQDWTAWLLAQPFGQWLAGLVGAAVIGVGLAQFWRAYSADFRDKLRLGEMSGDRAAWATRLGRLGFAARGVAFAIIGGFLLVAAVQARPEEARGLGGALDTLARQPFGPWLLGVVALGLIAYGLFELVEARYRRIVVG